jgi:hypothetical protein
MSVVTLKNEEVTLAKLQVLFESNQLTVSDLIDWILEQSQVHCKIFGLLLLKGARDSQTIKLYEQILQLEPDAMLKETVLVSIDEGNLLERVGVEVVQGLTHHENWFVRSRSAKLVYCVGGISRTEFLRVLRVGAPEDSGKYAEYLRRKSLRERRFL